MNNTTAKVTACPFCVKLIEAGEEGSLEYSQWDCYGCQQVRLREEYKKMADQWAWNLSPAEVAQAIKYEDLDEDLILDVVEEVFGPDTRWAVEDTLDVL